MSDGVSPRIVMLIDAAGTRGARGEVDPAEAPGAALALLDGGFDVAVLAPDGAHARPLTGVLTTTASACERFEPGSEEATLAAVLDAPEWDVLHVQEPRAIAAAARAVGRRREAGRRAWWVCDLDHDPARTGPLAGAPERVTGALLRDADAVIADGEALAETLLARYGLAQRPVVLEPDPARELLPGPDLDGRLSARGAADLRALYGRLLTEAQVAAVQAARAAAAAQAQAAGHRGETMPAGGVPQSA